MEQRNQAGKPGARSFLWSRGTRQANLDLGVVYGAEEPAWTGKPGARSCLWIRGTKQVNLELGVDYGAEEPINLELGID